jgi:hypothetical protein
VKRDDNSGAESTRGADAVNSKPDHVVQVDDLRSLGPKNCRQSRGSVAI